MVITTSGDRGVRASGPGDVGKALWTREIEEALHRGDIDLAVHSLKDLPGDLPPGLVIGGVLPREDPRDVLIHAGGALGIHDLPDGARIGTGSTRRSAFLLSRRPDLEVLPLKGNVPTRIARLDAGDFDGIVLAAAGLRRLGIARRDARTLEPDEMCPALGQGIVAVEVRESDAGQTWTSHLSHEETVVAMTAERALLRTLGVGCGAPVGGLATVRDGRIAVRGVILSPDGRETVEERREGTVDRAEALGIEVASALLDGAGRAILERSRSVVERT